MFLDFMKDFEKTRPEAMILQFFLAAELSKSGPIAALQLMIMRIFVLLPSINSSDLRDRKSYPLCLNYNSKPSIKGIQFVHSPSFVELSLSSQLGFPIDFSKISFS